MQRGCGPSAVCLIVLHRLLHRSSSANTGIARRAAHVLGLPFWFTALLVGIPTWFLVVLISRGRVDPGFATLVVVLTVQTSLDSAAANYSLRISRGSEEQRISEVASLTVAIREELDRSRERDEATVIRDEQSSLRDSALIGLVRELIKRLPPETAHD